MLTRFARKWSFREKIMLSVIFLLAVILLISFQVNGPLLKRPFKTILIWNSPGRAEMLIFGSGHDVFARHNCPVSDCELVNSPHQFPDRPVTSYDAIIFNINDQNKLERRPTERLPSQRYIFLTQEPPTALKDQSLDTYPDFFNWTMTYTNDSDIRMIYGRIRHKPTAPKTLKRLKNAILKASQHPLPSNKKKEKLVAAMISNCHTDGRREDYIRELRKHIPVDVYGWCNTPELGFGLNCAFHELLSASPECYEMLDQNYRFYLSFENSICPEYVTEKFYNVMSEKRRIVPVVYGGADYDRLTPPHSHINAMRYEPSKLADLLKEVAANETLYEEYFWWKQHYVVEAGLSQMVSHAFCDLCQKLHEDDGRYQSIGSVASKGDLATCRRPTFEETRI